MLRIKLDFHGSVWIYYRIEAGYWFCFCYWCCALVFFGIVNEHQKHCFSPVCPWDTPEEIYRGNRCFQSLSSFMFNLVECFIPKWVLFNVQFPFITFADYSNSGLLDIWYIKTLTTIKYWLKSKTLTKSESEN